MSDLELDAYEQEILDAYERGDMKSTATREKLEWLREAARGTGAKDSRVNIRLSSADLQDIKARALEEGLPYQTLMSSVLHKYVTGKLIDPADGQQRAA